jgi:hypothetical protein
MIPNGTIEVSRATLSLDLDTRFLYVVRDQFKDFEVLQLCLQETSSDADKLDRNSQTSLYQCSDWVQVVGSC